MTRNIENHLKQSSYKLLQELQIINNIEDENQQNLQDFYVLNEISLNPLQNLTEISQNLYIHYSTISRIVADLVAEKFISEKNSEDGREKLLKITAKGQDQIEKFNQEASLKTANALRYLGQKDKTEIHRAIKKYLDALQKSRQQNRSHDAKILTLSNSRDLRNRVKNMIENIQKNEFGINVDNQTNACIISAEDDFYYNNSSNFFYATDQKGRVVGSIGLKKIDNKNAELKKFFVTKEFRRQGLGNALFERLITAANKHDFRNIYLGSIDILDIAQNFYKRHGFKRIPKADLPKKFDTNPLDNVFFGAKLSEIAV